MRAPTLRLHHDELIVARRNRGRFVAGVQYAPDTQFQKGRAAENKLPVGSERTRIETNSGLPRVWVKVAEPNVWRQRAIVVWELAHGALPRGKCVHHKDRDQLNDAPENLVALTRKQHLAEHKKDLVLAAAARLGLRLCDCGGKA